MGEPEAPVETSCVFCGRTDCLHISTEEAERAIQATIDALPGKRYIERQNMGWADELLGHRDTLSVELLAARAALNHIRAVVLEEHERVQYGHDGIAEACARCSSWSLEGLDDGTVPWPCSTVAALAGVREAQ